MRRRTRIASLTSILLLPAAHASAQLTSSIVTGPLGIGLEQVTTVAGPSLDLTHAGDGTDRIFLAGQSTADVRLFKNNALLSTPFLDVNGTGATGAGLSLQTTGERGLLGMAFHPNYAVAGQPGFGKFYTFTSETKNATNFAGVDFIHDELDGTDAAPANLGDHDSVIREWTVNAANPDQINIDTTSSATRANSSRVIMRIRKPQSNHNGGSMKFGPDGLLYIALGDGGGGNDENGAAEPDGHTDASTSPARPRGNAQDVSDYAADRNENVLGKILRIDPRLPTAQTAAVGPASLNGQYRIPSANPRLGASDGADEIFAYGLRNAFRMSFDRLTGSLYAGDVGQTQREEIDVITSGGNYGWVYWEGSRVNFAAPAGLNDIKPIGEYTHADGQAVIGGFVYRGNNIPELYGKYVFGELGWNDPATPETTSVGRVFYMDAAGGTINQFTYLLNAPNAQLYAFGEDRDGEMYAMFADGNVRHILGRQWLAMTGGTWGDAANWLGSVPTATGSAANFLGRVSAAANVPATITLDGSRTVGSMLFNNDVTNAQSISYRIAQGSGGTLTISNGAAVATVKVIKGNQQITAPVTIGSNAEFDIAAAGSIDFTNSVNIVGTRTLTKKGAGTAALSGGATLQPTSTLAVTAGILAVRNVSGGTITVNNARLNVTPNGGTLGTSKVAALNVINGGTLDLRDNKFIVANGNVGTSNGSTYTGLTGLIQSGANGGAWNGDGIMTSETNAAGGLTALGIATAAQAGYAGGNFSGIAVVNSDVLIMYTYAGDANLDGFISGDDYSSIDFNIGTNVAGWYNGDFNYDGIISGDDYSSIDFNYVAQGAPFSTSGAANRLTAVPEPAGALTLAAAASLSLLRRRRAVRKA